MFFGTWITTLAVIGIGIFSYSEISNGLLWDKWPVVLRRSSNRITIDIVDGAGIIVFYNEIEGMVFSFADVDIVRVFEYFYIICMASCEISAETTWRAIPVFPVITMMILLILP